MKIFSVAPKWVEIQGGFDDSCILNLAQKTNEAGVSGRLKLRIINFGGDKAILNAKISLESISGNILIFIGADNASVHFCENTSGSYDLRLWRNASVTVGKNTTSNGVRIVTDLSEVKIGEDCMFSDDVLIQSSDQHGLVDLKSGKIVNNRMRHVHIGDHIWLGRRSTLMPDISIGMGSVIGAGAIVTKNIPEFSVAAGVPAKVVKTGTTWSRSPIELDAMAKNFVAAHPPADSCVSDPSPTNC